MRKGNNFPFQSYLLLTVMVGLAVSCCFLPEASRDVSAGIVSLPWLSGLSAMLVLAAVAVSMGLLNYSSFLFTSDVRRLYLPYLITVLSIPGVTSFGWFHIAALLTVWAMFFAAGYVTSEKVRMDYAFGAAVMSGSASIMVPSMVYVEIFIFLYCVCVRSQHYIRYLLAFWAGAALPWLYAFVLGFVFPDSVSPADCVENLRQGMRLAFPTTDGLGTVAVVWYIFILVFAFRSAIFVLFNGRDRKKAQKNAFGFSVALSLIFLLTAIFCQGLGTPLFMMVAAVPVSFVTFDFLTNGRRGEVSLWITLLILLAVGGRVLDFLPGVQF